MRAVATCLAVVMMVATTAPALAGVYEERERDWHNGAVVCQVIVDRLAPAANLDTKRALYAAPKVLRRWDEVPVADNRVAPNTQVTRQELDFWAGDLQSLRGRLDPVQALGADVLHPVVAVYGGFVRITLPPRSLGVLAPDVGTQGGYSVHKRVRSPP